MSRILDATCEAGIVTVENHVITPATIISNGVKASDGLGLLQGDKLYYITSNASDISDLIDNVKAIVDQIKIVLLALDAVTVSPGATTSLTAVITTLEAALTAQKANLK